MRDERRAASSASAAGLAMTWLGNRSSRWERYWRTFVVVKGSRRNLYTTGKLELFGGAIEVHFLAHQLIRAVLSRSFNHHGVAASLYRFPEVIGSSPS